MRVLILAIQLAFISAAFSSQTPAAKTLKELHQQIRAITKNKLMDKYFDAQDEAMDKLCGESLKHGNVRGIKLELANGNRLKNYAKVSSDTSRFSIPSLSALTFAHTSGRCDRAITLMGMCTVLKYDPTPDGKLWVPENVNTMNTKMRRAAGDEIVRVMDLMEADGIPFKNATAYSRDYSINGGLCKNANDNDWHVVLPVDSSTNNIKEIFQALELVNKWRSEDKTICFHCHAGKHRTGILAALIKLLDAYDINEDLLADVYYDYVLHTWHKKCQSKEKVKTIIPLIIQSKPFIDIKAVWND